MMGDFVERNAVMNSIIAEYNRKGDRDGLKLAWIEKAVNEVPSALEQRPCDAVSREAAVNACLNGWNKDYKEIVADIRALPSVTPAEEVGHWIPVSERLPELNKPLLVTAYHRVCYAHMISESGNYGYPVFRLHEIKDSDRGWVQETISHEPYSMGRIDAWMYIDIPEPYNARPTGAEGSDKE